VDELRLAPVGSYDSVVCDDLSVPRAELVGTFDLIVSWQVLEHVRHLGTALNTLRSYLSATGRLVALLSGRYSSFGLANRFLPDRVGQQVAAYVTRREPETVFRAYYDECYFDGLVRLFADWTRAEVHPRYHGEVYFRFSRYAHRAYLSYESWAYRAERRNLATHYFVVAEP
jgi:hypothetical protein